jgi:hypothetical protein
MSLGVPDVISNPIGTAHPIRIKPSLECRFIPPVLLAERALKGTIQQISQSDLQGLKVRIESRRYEHVPLV